MAEPEPKKTDAPSESPTPPAAERDSGPVVVTPPRRALTSPKKQPKPRPVSRAPQSVRPRPSSYRPSATNTWRFVRAYYTTFVVIASYLWLSSWGKILGDNWRAARIAQVHRRNAALVNATILELQGLFIKVGQLLSIMANFLPEEFREGLEGLQDQVPPRPYSEIAERIKTELGSEVDDLFAEFDRTPLASASLGQVHEARLPSGLRVAVKIQHKDIDEMVKLDLVTIRRIMAIVQWFVPLQGLDQYYSQIKALLYEELDFEREANNIDHIAKNFEKNPMVVFPTPIREYSTKRVITQTFVEGVKVGDIASIDALGIDRKDLASRLVRAYCQMIFVDGIYHADPHPGNVFVRQDGALILLDFGAVAELSPQMRDGIPEFLEGVLRRDTQRLMKALKKMGFLAKDGDERVSEALIEHFHKKFQEEVKIESFNLKDVKIDPQKGFENLLDLRKMNIGLKELSSTFLIPRDWVLLERTILLLYGCCALLDPELNPASIVKPYLQDFVLGNRDWQQLAMEAVRDMAMGAVTLPEDFRKYLTKATRGELEMRVRGVHEGGRAVYSVGRQIIYASFVIACGFGALQLHFHGEDGLARWPLAFGGISLLFLLVSSILGRPKGR